MRQRQQPTNYGSAGLNHQLSFKLCLLLKPQIKRTGVRHSPFTTESVRSSSEGQQQQVRSDAVTSGSCQS